MVKYAVGDLKQLVHSNLNPDDQKRAFGAYAACLHMDYQLLNTWYTLSPNTARDWQRDKVNISALTENITELVKVIKHIKGYRKEIELHLDFECIRNSNANLYVNLYLLSLAHWNIIINAFDYCYRNSLIAISAKIITSNMLEIKVENYGIQIAVDEVDMCFQNGWRSKVAERVTGSGYGRGLFVAADVISRYGGEVSITPTANHKTVVRILLPIE